MGRGGKKWMQQAEDGFQWRPVVNTVILKNAITRGKHLAYSAIISS